MSLTQQIATLVAAIVAASASLVTLFLNSRLTLDRERRQAVWRKEIDRLYELEELAGELIELAGGYGSFEAERERMVVLLEQTRTAAGRFARYPRVQQAIRDLNNVCGRMFVTRRDHQDNRGIRTELRPAYEKLLAATDAVIGPRALHDPRAVARR